jgi:predicted AAA+ superfamily ATPase
MNEKLIEEFFVKLGRVEGINREIMIPAIRNKAICIVGPRKAGKTWLLRMLSTDELYVDFQDIAFRGIKIEDIFKILEIYSRIFGKRPTKIFIDEVREVDGWETMVLSLFNRGYEVYLS